MGFPVYIGYDSRFPIPAKVAEHTLRQNSSIPLAVHFLDLAHLRSCHGFDRENDPLQSTEFTYTRFLVPYLCGYEGKALFADNDIVVLGDVAEIADLPMQGPTDNGWSDYALRVVKHDHQVDDGSKKMYGAIQTAYPRKNQSSVMLMNCAKLKLWTFMKVQTASGAYLHRFQDISDEQIGDLPPEWNHLDHYEEGKTKLLHYTSGGPWYKEYENCPHAEVWKKAYGDWQRTIGCEGI